MFSENGNNGLIQAIMDEEIMHGATVQIMYEVKIKNIGETDYNSKEFYYKGTGANEQNKVTTTANTIIDYVANNLQYNSAANQGWAVANAQDLVAQGLISKNVEEGAKQFNTILTSSELAQNLKPNESTKTANLLLTKVITASNQDDDKTYENITEILQTSNTVGRRMAYSVVGNQNPTQLPAEVDSSRAERVVILPPFGTAGHVYYALAIAVMLMLVGGVTLIKKKVLG